MLIDLALNTTGDIIFFETEKTSISNRISLTFTIDNKSINKTAFAFTFSDNFKEQLINTPCISFKINDEKALFDCLTLKDVDVLKQLCYNALRSKKNDLTGFGSYLYKYENTQINNKLDAIKKVAYDALKDVVDSPIIDVKMHYTKTGECIITFEITIQSHKINLEL